jgi:TniB protein
LSGHERAKQALMTDQQLADRFEAFDLPAWTDDAAFAQLVKSFWGTSTPAKTLGTMGAEKCANGF